MNIIKKAFAVKGLDGHKALQVVKTRKKDNVFRIRFEHFSTSSWTGCNFNDNQIRIAETARSPDCVYA